MVVQYEKDFITGLDNMKYLETNYSDFILKNKNAKVIEIDLTKFKGINDNYGHEEGDACLRAFSEIIQKLFKKEESFIVRRGGDEFAIVTAKNNDEIVKSLNIAKDIISIYKDSGKVSVAFDFNAGVAPAEHSIKNALQKADVMMYDAKEKKKTVTLYDEKIFLKFINDQNFVSDFEEIIRKNDFELAENKLYRLNGEETNVSEIYTKTKLGLPFYDPKIYKLLLKEDKIKYLDSRNILKVCQTFDFDDERHIVDIHNQTLNDSSFLRKINSAAEFYGIKRENAILNIDVGRVDYDMKTLIRLMNGLKDDGFKICLESFGENTSNIEKLTFFSDVDYIKINTKILKHAQMNKKIKNYLKYNIQCFNENDIIPILGNIENEEEYKFIKDVSERQNVLVKGNLFDKTI